jgi:hypothetical protein
MPPSSIELFGRAGRGKGSRFLALLDITNLAARKIEGLQRQFGPVKVFKHLLVLLGTGMLAARVLSS